MPQTTAVPNGPQRNGDENLRGNIGNFHKTLIHGDNGIVDAAGYAAFVNACEKEPHAFHMITRTPGAINLNNPQAGLATDTEGPNPTDVEMPAPPRVLSDVTAAEMTELYWMALLRDSPLETLGDDDNAEFIQEIRAKYQLALDTPEGGALRSNADLPFSNGNLDINAKTVFRCGLRHENKGPLISQFMLHDINYGAQLISQTVVPYKEHCDYLTGWKQWLEAQNTGKDGNGFGYSSDNNFTENHGYYEPGLPRRRLGTMRHLARFVNRDALHQAYFNAALLLLAWGVPQTMGNPYAFKKDYQQDPFGTLGGPNLLALVSEVASRALKVVWRQKFLVHRRLRPEVYGGLMQLQAFGAPGQAATAMGIPDWVFETRAAQAVLERNRTVNDDGVATHLLPMAFSAGSPPHPSYGAGHASVAGACVTILKAWFDTGKGGNSSIKIADLFSKINAAAAGHPRNRPDAGIGAVIDPPPPSAATPAGLYIMRPGTARPDGLLPQYAAADAGQMTVLGELNKLAANVAMGRSMGGVHWRTDNTRSLRLGEKVATIILKRLWPTYREHKDGLKFEYLNFDNNLVTIDGNSTSATPAAEVTVAGDPALAAFYNAFP